MKTILAIICLLVFLSISCTKDNSPIPNIPEGAYEYQSFDTSGLQIISGWIKIDFADSNNLTGTWNLTKIGDPQNIGHQTGEGNLGGSVDNMNFWINLNPGVADDNVILNGIIIGKTIEGDWFYSTFAGAINAGKFKGQKN